jgi:hypothetical protein
MVWGDGSRRGKPLLERQEEGRGEERRGEERRGEKIRPQSNIEGRAYIEMENSIPRNYFEIS